MDFEVSKIARWTPEELAAYQKKREPLKIPTLAGDKALVISSEPIKKPSKYRNKPTQIGTHKFDSKKEAARWRILQARTKLREGDHDLIIKLQHHTVFPLEVNGVHICNYEADFTYVIPGYRPITDILVVEDVKSAFTRKNPVYRLKKKLMKAIHGIEIQEV